MSQVPPPLPSRSGDASGDLPPRGNGDGEWAGGDEARQSQFPCRQCGAILRFRPGADALHCPYCGATTPIPQSADAIEELDYHAYLHRLAEEQETLEERVVACRGCGARTTLPSGITADECPFCGAAVVVQSQTQRLIKPRSLLPFHVTREQAQKSFRDWIHGLWFAPNALKNRAEREGKLAGVYVPYWTYDCHATTWYRGERGEDYWTTETYTTRVNGKTVVRTRQVRRTRWYPASGTVWNRFDDVLVLASRSLPRQYCDRLEPWDLNNLVDFRDDYLAGFRAESYSVNLDEGFATAQEMIQPAIRHAIERDIGGDRQRIHAMRSRYDDVTFKHLLLPVWLSAYRYNDRVYRFLVNARTGEVQGERPYSWIKITLAVLLALIVLGVVALLSSGDGMRIVMVLPGLLEWGFSLLGGPAPGIGPPIPAAA